MLGALRNVTFSGCLVACACSDPPKVPDASDATLIPGGIIELGTGETEFVPIAAEQVLGVVTGPQGGNHFIINARVRDIAVGDPMPGLPENPATRWSVYREDGKQIDKLYPAWRGGYVPVQEGWFELPSGRILEIDRLEIPALYSQRVRIRVVVTDSVGHRATDERWVIAQPAEDIRRDAAPRDARAVDAGAADGGPVDGPDAAADAPAFDADPADAPAFDAAP